MTPEEFQKLAEKAAQGTVTPEEELQLLQELNRGSNALRDLIKVLKSQPST